jgi:hypothetical protein
MVMPSPAFKPICSSKKHSPNHKTLDSHVSEINHTSAETNEKSRKKAEGIEPFAYKAMSDNDCTF